MAKLDVPPAATTAAELPLVIGQLRRRLGRSIGDVELSWSQVAVISRLAKEGGMSPSQLARSESMRPQSMRTLLLSLEKLGLVERQDHPTDRRQVVFSLTPAGIQSDKKRRAARQEWLIEAISSLEEDEQRVLAEAIDVLRQLGNRE